MDSVAIDVMGNTAMKFTNVLSSRNFPVVPQDL
jgi:hypothetical protein